MKCQRRCATREPISDRHRANTERIVSLTGTAKYRVPDVLNHAARLIGEVKNVGRLSYTDQLKDFVLYAQKNGYRFELILRQGAVISDELQQAVRSGAIVLKRIRM